MSKIVNQFIGNGNISRKMFWEKMRLKAQRYDMGDPEKIGFQSVPIPKEVIGRLEELRDSRELPQSMWAIIASILDSFVTEFR